MKPDEYQLLLNTIDSYETAISDMVERMAKQTDALTLIKMANENHQMRTILRELEDAKKDYLAQMEAVA